MAFPTWAAITAPPAKTIGLKAFWPSDRKPRPAARSVCVATRYNLILETLHRKEVQRSILQIHLNRRKRKTGVLTRLNHQPAALTAPVFRVCQLELPLISNSVLTIKREGINAMRANTVSGRTLSRQRAVRSNTFPKDGSTSPLTNSVLRNSSTRLRHRRSIFDSERIRIGTAIKRRTLIARSRKKGILICRPHATPPTADKMSRGSHVISTAAKALLSTRRRPSPA